MTAAMIERLEGFIIGVDFVRGAEFPFIVFAIDFLGGGVHGVLCFVFVFFGGRHICSVGSMRRDR
jgi:hypothetical protein